MKHLKIILLLAMFFGSAEAFAQYGYGYPYDNTMGGVDRRIDTQRNAPRTKNKKANEKRDVVEVTVEQWDKKLNLDNFQEAAITSIYNENKDQLLSIAEQDIPKEAKKEKLKEITEKIDKQVLKLLSKEQAEIYQKMIAERKY